MDALTDKQRAYVMARMNGLEPVAAVREAYDYKPDVKRTTIYAHAYELEKHPVIVAAMRRLSREAVSDAVMSRREALERLSRIARASVADVIELAPDEATGGFKPRVKTGDPAALEAVSRLSDTRQGLNVQMHSPLHAIKQLAEMLGWEAPKRVEQTVTDPTAEDPMDLSGLTEDTLMELWNAQAANTSRH